MITAAQLKLLVSYDSETGILTWLPRDNARWNEAYVGKPALANISDGYRIGRVKNVQLKAHRVAWAIYYGEWPNDEVDHINGNRSDNRIANLRVVGRKENSRNLKTFSTNTSGHRGVFWNRRSMRWEATIQVNRRCLYLGIFHDMASAIAARKEAEITYGFHENHGRTVTLFLDKPGVRSNG